MSQPVQVQVYRNGVPSGQVVLDGQKKVNKIGKIPSAQIKIDDPQASRVHAVLEVSRAGVWLIDMGSAVGTQLNGKRVNKAKLNSGDQIVIGTTVMVVSFGAQQAMPASPPTGGTPANVGQASMTGATMVQPQPQPPPMQPQPSMQQQPMQPPVMQQQPMQQQPMQPPVMPQQTMQPPAMQSPAMQPPAMQPPAMPQQATQPPATPAPSLPATPVGSAAQGSAPPQAAAPAGEGSFASAPAPGAGWGGPPPSSLGPLRAPSSPSQSSSLRPAAFGSSSPTKNSFTDTDSNLSIDDPALRRLQASRTRNRIIGSSVIGGIVVVTGAFIFLGSQGEGPKVVEPANYSAFGKNDPTRGTSAGEPAEGETEETATAAAADAGRPAQEGEAAADAGGESETADKPPSGEGSGVVGETDAAAPAAAEAAPSKNAAGAASKASGARDPDRFRVEVLQASESLEDVAQRLYGDTSLARLLRDANSAAGAGALAAGTEVRVPKWVIHEVAPGDSLGVIAKVYLGEAKRYEEIFEANQDVLESPSAVDVGMKLKIILLAD